MKDREKALGISEDVFVARQPIFDRGELIWGYELLYRAALTARAADFANADMATLKVIGDGFLLVSDGLLSGQKIFVNFPQNLLLSDAAFALPPEKCIVEILEDVIPEQELIAALQRLNAEGYTLALDDYIGQEKLEPLLRHVRIVKVDVLGVGSLDRVADLVAVLKKYDVTLLAEKVEDLETFKALREMGFDLFQGYFFSRPEVIPGRKVSALKISKVQLLQELGSDDIDCDSVSKIIKMDPSISYRLLKYVNMAGQSGGHNIDSVERAVTMLGQRQLVQWLRAIILSDLNPSMKASELSFMAVARGHLLELLSEQNGPDSPDKETLFLLGLFSVLDAILELPMGELLEPLSLDGEVRAALTGKESGLTEWLGFVKACEGGEWEQTRKIAAGLGLDVDGCGKLCVQTLAWTQSIMESARVR